MWWDVMWWDVNNVWCCIRCEWCVMWWDVNDFGVLQHPAQELLHCVMWWDESDVWCCEMWMMYDVWCGEMWRMCDVWCGEMWVVRCERVMWWEANDVWWVLWWDVNVWCVMWWDSVFCHPAQELGPRTSSLRGSVVSRPMLRPCSFCRVHFAIDILVRRTSVLIPLLFGVSNIRTKNFFCDVDFSWSVVSRPCLRDPVHLALASWPWPFSDYDISFRCTNMFAVVRGITTFSFYDDICHANSRTFFRPENFFAEWCGEMWVIIALCYSIVLLSFRRTNMFAVVRGITTFSFYDDISHANSRTFFRPENFAEWCGEMWVIIALCYSIALPFFYSCQNQKVRGFTTDILSIFRWSLEQSHVWVETVFFLSAAEKRRKGSIPDTNVRHSSVGVSFSPNSVVNTWGSYGNGKRPGFRSEVVLTGSETGFAW